MFQLFVDGAVALARTFVRSDKAPVQRYRTIYGFEDIEQRDIPGSPRERDATTCILACGKVAR